MSIHFNSYTSEWVWLSCFYRWPLLWKGTLWPGAEWAYQAAKFNGELSIQEKIRRAVSPQQAKFFGHHFFHQDKTAEMAWERSKVDVMVHIQAAKFDDPQMRGLLLSTGYEVLIHKAPWDAFWGDGRDGRGENRLGLIIMERREIIRNVLTEKSVIADGGCMR